MTDDNVATFIPVDNAPDPDVVAELETALERAYAGELRSAVVVGALTEGRTYTSFATHDLPRDIGLVAFLLHTLCARQRETPG